jgi:thioredoxin reductase (NADPH)
MQYDVIVIGCGPAGMQAALHAARKKVKVLVLGKQENSALARAHIDNYFGVVSMEGKELLDKGRAVAEKFGAQFLAEDALEISKVDDLFHVKTDRLTAMEAKALILAPGISRVKLNVDGEKELHGMGVSYCSTCDCHFYKKKTVAVVGDGSMAAASALLLRDYASKVFWMHRELKASDTLLDKVRASDIEMVAGWPSRIVGVNKVEALQLEDGRVFALDGVFIELGAKGAAEMAMDLGILPDDNGYVAVDSNCKTEAEGVYACGDLTGKPWQLARAVGQGCIAGLAAASFVRKEEE